MTATTSSTTTTTGSPPEVGQKAPDFTLPVAGTKETWTLSKATQKGPVVLAFFPGAFTGTCTKEFCTFTADWGQFEKLGAQVVGVNVDSVHSQKAWAEKEHIKIPLVSDFEKKVVPQYGIVWNAWWGLTSKRAVFVVDQSGVVRYRWVSEDAGVEPNYADLKAALQKLE